MKIRIHRMLRSGSTTGAVSGRPRAWQAGQTIAAPEGEFDHVSQGTFEVITPKEAKESPQAETAESKEAKQAETAAKKPSKRSTKRKKK